MGRTNRNYTVNPVVATTRAQPGSSSQTTHAVAYQQRWFARGLRYFADGLLHPTCVVVN